MKSTFLDRLIGLVSPSAEARRLRARAEIELAKRAYDIASMPSTSDWISANANSANSETKNAIAPGRQKARALVQNNPYATKAVNVVVANTIGPGIMANIKARTKTQEKKLQELWLQWAETTACDYEGRQNFYGLQSLAMRAAVESGEALAKFPFTKDGPKIQLLESDFIDTSKDEGRIVQGVELDEAGRRVAYHLFETHPGDRFAVTKTIRVPADEVAHVYKQERPGQVRGVTWAHAVVEKLKDFDDYQHATLIRQKVAACFAGFVTTNGGDSLVDAATLKEKREAEFQMSPGSWRYLGQNEDIKFASPPPAEGYSEFSRETLRAVAAGFGVSYESLSGDYSQSNYSSSRMGHIEFRRNIEAWRWQMFIPQFCEPAFKKFLKWAAMQGVATDGVTVKWVPPAHSMIDPTKEVESLKKEVRSGFKSWGEALQELGRDPDETLTEIKSWNEKFDAAEVVLDTDPRRMSQVGLAQSSDPLSLDNSTNEVNNSVDQNTQTDAPQQSDSGSNQ